MGRKQNFLIIKKVSKSGNSMEFLESLGFCVLLQLISYYVFLGDGDRWSQQVSEMGIMSGTYLF